MVPPNFTAWGCALIAPVTEGDRSDLPRPGGVSAGLLAGDVRKCPSRALTPAAPSLQLWTSLLSRSSLLWMIVHYLTPSDSICQFPFLDFLSRARILPRPPRRALGASRESGGAVSISSIWRWRHGSFRESGRRWAGLPPPAPAGAPGRLPRRARPEGG